MNFEKDDFLNKIYEIQEEELDKILKEEDKKIKNKLYKINLEEIKNNKEILDKIEENNNIKISSYTKAFYTKGFIDGVNMIISCLKK